MFFFVFFFVLFCFFFLAEITHVCYVKCVLHVKIVKLIIIEKCYITKVSIYFMGGLLSRA